MALQDAQVPRSWFHPVTSVPTVEWCLIRSCQRQRPGNDHWTHSTNRLLPYRKG